MGILKIKATQGAIERLWLFVLTPVFPMKFISALSHAFKLFISAYALGVVLFGVWFWIAIFLGVATSIAALNPIPFTVLVLIGILILLTGLLWYLFLGFFYSILLKIMWSKPPQWARPFCSKEQALKNYGIAIAASFPLAIIIFLHISFHSGIRTFDEFYVSPKGYALETIFQLWWLWFITTFSLYYWKGSHKKSFATGERSAPQ
ncbi:MAG TPA: hypothetical protein V6D10_05825 [Trichocoleus sp.]